MRVRWSQLGGQLGIILCVAGLVLIFLGWNGAASYDRVPSQFPYLISGGVAGLALVVVGAATIVVQSQRADRAALQKDLTSLREAVERLAAATAASAGNGHAALAPAALGAAGMVVAGPTTFHRAECRLVQGKALPLVSLDDARRQGLRGCRTCRAEDLAAAPAG